MVKELFLQNCRTVNLKVGAFVNEPVVTCIDWFASPYLPCTMGAGGDGKALLQQRLQLVLAHTLAPARQGRAVEGQLMLQERLAAEVLIVRVLDPPRDDGLVR